jgi:HEAT repeat protein
MTLQMGGAETIELDMFSLDMLQPALFDLADASVGSMELFPAVWSAAEGLAAPDLGVRHAALERLLELKAPRLSPLVAYLLATRITEPDLPLRARVVEALGAIFAPDERGRPTPDTVRRYLTAYLSQMRTRSLFALLEVTVHAPQFEAAVARLLNVCPYAGNHLVEILSERKLLLAIRRQAIYFIGRVGYLDAIPALERLATRLETRLNGQQSMPFVPTSGQEESELLPAIHKVLQSLRAA